MVFYVSCIVKDSQLNQMAVVQIKKMVKTEMAHVWRSMDEQFRAYEGVTSLFYLLLLLLLYSIKSPL